MSLLTTANSIKEAITVLSDLYDRGERSVLIRNTGASKSSFDRLNKEIRKSWYCRRTTDGFIVMQRRPDTHETKDGAKS